MYILTIGLQQKDQKDNTNKQINYKNHVTFTSKIGRAY